MGLAGGAALLWAGSFQATRAPASPAASSEAAPPASSPSAGDETRSFLPEAGYRYTYAFRRDVKFEGDLGSGLPKVSYTGQFHADILRADARSFEAVLSEKIQGADSPSRPLVRIEADARGDALHVFSLNGLTELEKQHASVVKDLAALWLFPLRSDTTGDFEARFDPLPAEQGYAREKKTKLAYRSKAPNTPAILSSEHHLRWSFALHLPVEVKGRESTRLGKGNTALLASSAYELLYTTRAPSPALSQAALAALRQPDSLALDTSHPDLSEHPDYAHLDWNTLLRDLKDAGKLTNSKQLALFGDVLKFLHLHPEKASDLASLLLDPALLKAGAASPEFRSIVGALATFASPDSLTALRDAYQDANLAGPGKGMILSSLTTTQAQLDSATRDFLAQQMQSATDPRLSQAAAFALGSALQNAPGDAQSARAVELLSQNLAAASSVPAELAALDVIGNSGRADFVPSLETVIQGDAPAQVRARAVFALRFVNTPGAAQDLVSALASSEAAIRESAANAIATGTWREAFRAPLTQCSSRESVTRIQASCAQTLSVNAQVAAAH